MVATTSIAALFAASLFSMASAGSASASASASSVHSIASGTYTGALSAMETKGCYSSYEPLVDYGSYTYQSSGNCQNICVGLKKPVLGLVNGESCYCGDLLPAKADEVDDDECDTPCNGYPEDDCGGNERWRIILTGLTKNKIANYVPDSSSSSSTGTSTSSQSSSTTVIHGSTIVVTVAPTSSSSSGSSSPNKAGIAAGVVVGVVAIAGIVAGVYFYLRHKRKLALEEEHRRQAQMGTFFGAGKMPNTSHSSMNDTRLDPEVMLRRASDGSIADNQDYSRRILKVTNPDGN